MDILKKLPHYMKYIINTYPDGCAAYNWIQCCYNEILADKRLPKEYEVEDILEDCLKEFHYEDLGLCGCGCPEETYEVIRKILNIQSSNAKWEIKQQQFSELCNADMDNVNYSGLIQFVLYVLDDKGFLEHGSSISSAWLTEKGKIYLDLLNMWKEIKGKNRRIYMNNKFKNGVSNLLFKFNNGKYEKIDDKSYFIYHDDIMKEFVFNYRHTVPDDEIAVFLYKIFLTKPEEFKELVNKGRDILLEYFNEQENYKQWLLGKENENEYYKSFMK